MLKLNKYLFGLFAALTLLSPVAFAQEDASADVEEVVVTGSRIRNPNIASTSQVQVVTAADIENRGAIRIEEVLNEQ